MSESTAPPNPALTYLAGLEAIARQGRYDPLEQLLLARIQQRDEVIEGLSSPPLGRSEPDSNLLLFHLYQRLADAEGARDYLRRAAINLYLNTLGTPHGDLNEAGALARLIGFFQVAQQPHLARPLRLALWGLLRDGLANPLPQMIPLGGEELRRAIHALDLWLAITPPLCPDLSEVMRKQIQSTFSQHLAAIREYTLTEERFQLLLLAFRALLKIVPKQAGGAGLLDLCHFVEESRNAGEIYERRWCGLCSEVGISLAQPQYHDWREALRSGLVQQAPPENAAHRLYWDDAVERLGQAEWLRSTVSKKQEEPANNIIQFLPKQRSAAA